MTVIDLENYKCKNYYKHLTKFIYEKPRKWDKLSQEFYLRDRSFFMSMGGLVGFG